tara:strand:- start:91 stop:318 length:228 start_codon:yes stop_codon:yes gene_type:complete
MFEKNLSENEDPTWKMYMQTLMRRKKNMEIAQTIDEVLFRFYSDKGMKVPEWKTQKNPEWWTEYLISLGIDPKNP